MTEKNRYSNRYHTGYINDNLARKPEQAAPYYAPEKEPVQTPAKRKEAQPVRQTKENRGLRASFGMAFTALMVVSMTVILSVLVKYITLNIELSQKAKQITALRKELTTATMENDNFEMAVNSSIDYDYIYQVATQELGMVYASKSQIMTYEHAESEYVVQYKDVE